MSTLRLVWEVIRYRPGRWFFCFVMWTFVHGLPLLFGILIGLVFDRLAEGSPVDETAWAPAIAFGCLPSAATSSSGWATGNGSTTGSSSHFSCGATCSAG